MASYPSTDMSLLSSDDDEARENIHHHHHHAQKFRLRLQAANLPTCGRFRGKAPDTFAVVTSASEPAQQHLLPARQGFDTTTQRISSTTSNNSMSSGGGGGGDGENSITSSKTIDKIWGQTEVVFKSRNPHWAKTVKLDVAFSTTGSSSAFFYVHIFHHEKETSKCLGTALFEVDDLLSTKNLTRCKRLRGGGCVFGQLEPVREQHGDHLNNGNGHSNTHSPSPTVRLQIGASNLLLPRNGGLFTSNSNDNRKQHGVDTVLEIAKRGGGDSTAAGWIVVHRSAVIENSLNPVYDETSISLDDLCGESLDRQLRLYVYQLNGNGTKRSLIGLSETTLRHLLRQYSEGGTTVPEPTNVDNDEDDEVPLRGTAKLLLQRNSKKLKEVGRLHVLKATVLSEDCTSSAMQQQSLAHDRQPSPASVLEVVDLTKLTPLAVPSMLTASQTTSQSFESYLEQGCCIDLCVAIDFTSSNGDASKVGSNHYQNPHTLNDYEETICAIGQALAQYSDERQDYAVWGFGAKFGHVVRHIFQCGPTPTVTGVDGILGAYRSVFGSDLIMSGPTDFTHVLQAAAARAKRHHDNMMLNSNGDRRHRLLRYTVLLVITDGIMDNFEATRQRLELYSSMPLSIVFVGVGRSDFALMHELCNNTGMASAAAATYSASHPVPACNNTTFVTFRQHQQDPSALGEAALRNIPWQLCQYMQRQGI